MFDAFEIRTLALQSAWFRRKIESFLSDHGLRLDELPDTMLGIYDADDELRGCAARDGNVIKYVAISEEMRGHNATAMLISPLIAEAREAGFENVFIFTKPENEPQFRSLGFHAVGSAERAVMMEMDSHGIASYCRELEALVDGRPDPVGVIVMNANPLTRGHLYLIEQASRRCATLVIIPLAENAHNAFDEATRREMLERAASRFDNVIVAPSSPYAISAATFPSYFLKKKDEAAETQMRLDLDIFSKRIAPALRARIRFAGSEPTDPLTHQYNKIMKETLPKHGIELDEIDRLADFDGRPYSATAVRKNIREERLGRALTITAPEAVPAALAEGAAYALRTELELTPKPGLVDREGNASHSDMTFEMMQKSIDIMRPYFKRMADVTYFEAQPKAAELVEIGNEAEAAMLAASGGVNTHRGALFSLGIAVASAARLIAKRVLLNEENMRLEIAVIAEALPASKGVVPDSHGQNVVRNFNVKGAHATACEAYPDLFLKWLPAYRRMKEENTDFPELRLLLLIISRLEDTNVYHRAGREGALYAKEEARKVYADFSVEKVEEMKREFAARNISTGGAADMLALTLFIYSLLNKNINI